MLRRVEMEGKPVKMSQSGILDALKNEEKSLKTQLVAIQRAIAAIEGADAPVAAGRGKKKAPKVVAKRKRAMTEEQRQAVSERMRGITGHRGEKPRRRSSATCAGGARPWSPQPGSIPAEPAGGASGKCMR